MTARKQFQEVSIHALTSCLVIMLTFHEDSPYALEHCIAVGLIKSIMNLPKSYLKLRLLSFIYSLHVSFIQQRNPLDQNCNNIPSVCYSPSFLHSGQEPMRTIQKIWRVAYRWAEEVLSNMSKVAQQSFLIDLRNAACLFEGSKSSRHKFWEDSEEFSQ